MKPRYRFVGRMGGDYLFRRVRPLVSVHGSYYHRVPVATFWGLA